MPGVLRSIKCWSIYYRQVRTWRAVPRRLQLLNIPGVLLVILLCLCEAERALRLLNTSVLSRSIAASVDVPVGDVSFVSPVTSPLYSVWGGTCVEEVFTLYEVPVDGGIVHFSSREVRKRPLFEPTYRLRNVART